MTAILEHVNVTVSDARKTARMLQDLFDWHIRWEGDAINGGYSVHVGDQDSYVSVYSSNDPQQGAVQRNAQIGGMNHIGVVVDNLDATEQRVIAAGFKPHLHADYEPGRRFYFDAHDGVEIEVVSYS